jgi:hypothetical protein
MQNQRLKMPNTCKPCHFKIIWPVNWDYSSGQLVPRISDCKLNGFVWRMIPSEGISTALNIQSACPTPHQNSLLLVLCKAQAASLAAAPDARWYLEFPEAYTLARESSLMKTIYCATGAFLSYIECLCTLARAKIYPSWRAAGFKL